MKATYFTRSNLELGTYAPQGAEKTGIIYNKFGVMAQKSLVCKLPWLRGIIQPMTGENIVLEKFAVHSTGI